MADGADNDQEKTLPATQRRLEQAREEGQIPRSRTLASALLFVCAGIAMWMAGPLLTHSFGRVMQHGLTFDRDLALGVTPIGSRLLSLTLEAVIVALPLCLVLVIATMAASFLVGGWNFSSKALEPKWTKLNPLTGLSNMVSMPAMVELGKTLVEVFLVLAAVIVYVWVSLDEFPDVLQVGGIGPFNASGHMVMVAFAIVIGVVAFVATIDVPLQIWRHGHQLRMSLDEVKRESRESDGDPHLKARIRTAQREMAKKRMMQEVPKADVIVTNPTRYAVALKYDKTDGGAPQVVAKGIGEIARRIRELGTEAGVPLVEVPPLARALYAKAELGDEVPQALYTAVAQVLAFVYQLRSGGMRTRPDPYTINEAIEIPPGWDPLGGTLEVVAE
jgi:flagellar biosynthesis protein FlhB